MLSTLTTCAASSRMLASGICPTRLGLALHRCKYAGQWPSNVLSKTSGKTQAIFILLHLIILVMDAWMSEIQVKYVIRTLINDSRPSRNSTGVMIDTDRRQSGSSTEQKQLKENSTKS